MDYVALNGLIKTHPSWPTVTDAELVMWCNAEAMSRDKTTVGSGEIFAAILSNLSEWTALSATDREVVKDILYIHSGEGVPTAAGSPARNVLVAKLGANTKAAIAAKISEQVSRVAYVGIPGDVHIGDVQNARALG
jgi:hypothetical protein